MRILFISINRLRLILAPLPLGLASVVASLGPEHQFRVLDFMFAADPQGQLRREIAEFQPEIIGLSIRNIDNQDSTHPVSYVPEVQDLVARLRELTQAPIVLGGGGFNVMPREFMENTGADFGMVGEGEIAFGVFLSAYAQGGPWEKVPGLAWRTQEGWQLNPPHRVADLRQLPPPALEYFTPRLYQDTVGTTGLPGFIPVQSRRGCPMRCIYCTTPRLEGRHTRAWEPEQVASWLATWHQKFGLTRFYFVDNMFNCPADYGRRLCRAIAALNLPLEWSCLFNPAFPDPELIRLLSASGCAMVQVGNESGSELVLSKLGKGFKRQQVEQTLAHFNREGIPYTCFLLLGGPGETPATVQESVALLERYEPHLVNLKVGIRIHPGLPLHRLALAEGVVTPRDNLLSPRFYLAPAIREWIGGYLEGLAKSHPNWIM
jgi:radical SAM superfamily enzyme YgiQ (UPF0313 family)